MFAQTKIGIQFFMFFISCDWRRRRRAPHFFLNLILSCLLIGIWKINKFSMGIRLLQVGCIVIACIAAPSSFVPLFYPKNRKIELTAQLNEVEWMGAFSVGIWKQGRDDWHTISLQWANLVAFRCEKYKIWMVRRNPLLIPNAFCANWIWSSLTHKNRHKMHWKNWQKWRARTMVRATAASIYLSIVQAFAFNKTKCETEKKVSQETKAITTNKTVNMFPFRV